MAVDQRFSGTLTAEHVARIFTSDAASQIGGLLPPLPTITIGGAAGATRYLVALCNLDTGEQHLHPRGVERLTQWQLHFLDQPLLRRVDLVQEPAFPALEPPSATCWTQTPVFRKAGARFVAVAVLAPEAAIPAPRQDVVELFLCSPPLPADHASFLAAAPTSQHRRALATHHALAALARHAGFNVFGGGAEEEGTATASGGGGGGGGGEDAGLLHGDAVLFVSRTAPSRLRGAFVSNDAEDAAGSAVVPLALRHCRFLLPALGRGRVAYEIVQPHRYGYAFRVHGSLGGWQLYGTVNLRAPAFDALAALFLSGASSGAEDEEGAFFSVTSGDAIGVAGYTAACGRVADMLATKAAVTRAYGAALSGWRPADPEARAPFAIDAIARRTTDAQKRALPPDVWRPLIAHAGLVLIEGAARADLRRADAALSIERGRAFVDAWSESMTKPMVFTVSNASVVADLAATLFEACEGLAELVVADVARADGRKKGKFGGAALAAALTTGAERGGALLLLEIRHVTAFLRAARGTRPREWAARARPHLLTDPVAFARTLLAEPATYQALLMPLLRNALDLNNDTPIAAFFTRAKAHNPDIKRAAEAAQQLTSSSSARDVDDDAPSKPKKKGHAAAAGGGGLASALAYALFTNDADGLMRKWT